jgi:hypothetical protein
VIFLKLNLTAGGWDFYGAQIDIFLAAFGGVDEGRVQFEEISDFEPILQNFDKEGGIHGGES